MSCCSVSAIGTDLVGAASGRSCWCCCLVLLLCRLSAVLRGAPPRASLVECRPGTRRARENARRRTARSRQPGRGVQVAPPGPEPPRGSGQARRAGRSRPSRRRPAATRSWRPAPDSRRTCGSGTRGLIGHGHRRRLYRRAGPNPEWPQPARPLPGRGPQRLRRRRLVGTDVDAPAGEPGGEAGVLALLADRQRQLVVRARSPARPGVRVDDLDRR